MLDLMSTSTASTVSFHIRPLDGEQLQQARASVVGDTCEHPELVRPIVAEGGEPLRCCLRDAGPGERLILFHYRPPLPAPSPYRESGAVYAHADGSICPPVGQSESYPEGWRGRAQVLRAYDERGFIHPATRVHDGSEPERAIAEVLAQPGVVEVHSRNVAYGCYMFSIVRGA
jgi:hypothetical protein